MGYHGRGLMLGLVVAVVSSLSYGTSLAASTEGTVYAFGDSLLDLRFVCPFEYHNASGACGNGNGLLNYLPNYAPYTFNLANDHAAGGAGTGSFNVAAIILPSVALGPGTQIQEFVQAGGRIGANDLTLVSGRNDFYQILLGSSTNGAALAQQGLSNVSQEIAGLVSAGAGNIVYFDSHSPAAPNTQQINALEDAFSAGLPTTLAAYARPGVRLRLIDLDGLTTEVEANPTHYGFSTGLSCQADTACEAAAKSVQDQHFLFDQHPTEAGFSLIARYVANLDASDDALAAQASVAAAAADSFATALLDRATLSASQARANGLFLDAGYARASQADWTGDGGAALGYADDIGRITLGYSHTIAPDMLVGGAFGYAHSSAGLDGGDGDIRANSYEGGGFLDWRPGRFFVDASVVFAHHDLDVTRPGVEDNITAHPDAWSVAPVVRGGWLPKLGPVRLGPVAQFGYDHTHVDGYTEAGDPVLTQDVAGSNANTFNAQAGLRLESLASPGSRVQGFLQASASHDFASGDRLLRTDETYAPGLPVYTVIGAGWTDRTYGAFDGAATIRLAPGAQVYVQGRATAFRSGGQDYSGEVGFRLAL